VARWPSRPAERNQSAWFRPTSRVRQLGSHPATPPKCGLIPRRSPVRRLGSAMIRSHMSTRDSLVVLLTLNTGAVDVTSFLALGNVFSSVVTGDMVLLGAAAGTGRPELAVHSGGALAGYLAGVMAGAPLAARRHHASRTWPPSVTITLAVELVILVAFSVGWELAGTHPSGGGQLALVAVLAVAMGLQA